jgi:hypothetical protein
MYHSKLDKTSRLRFESGVMTQFDKPKRIRLRVGRLLAFVAVAAALVALAVWAVSSLRFPVRAAKGDAIARAASTLLAALKSGRLEQGLDVCAESEAGRKALLDDDRLRAKPNPEAKSAKVSNPKQGAIPPLEFLTTVRGLLESHGVVWGQVRPLAFGGMQASVQDLRHMKDPAVSVVGEIYFAAGDKVYALEISARCCGDEAVITDFWRCAPIDVPASAPFGALKDRTAERIRAFTGEPMKPGERVAIKSPRLVFVSLPDAAK